MEVQKKKVRFNIVDLIVLLVILALAAAVIYVFFAKEASEAVASKVECNAEVRIYGLEREVADEIISHDLVGEHTVSGTQYTPAVVTGIRAEPNREDPELSDIIATLMVEVAENTTGAANANQELRVGKEYIFKTRTVECTGIVTKVEIGGSRQ